jgi:hypothetical protein
MKHCPACNFTFPDFHLVCDFDGTELVPDPQRLALIKIPVQRSFVSPLKISTKTLMAMAIVGLFLGAAFIAYQLTTSRSARTLLAVSPTAPPLQTVPVDLPRVASVAPAAGRKRSTQIRHASQVRLMDVHNRHEKRTEPVSRQTEVARYSQPPAPEKPPKLVAVFKTTWRVLKKPFSF